MREEEEPFVDEVKGVATDIEEDVDALEVDLIRALETVVSGGTLTGWCKGRVLRIGIPEIDAPLSDKEVLILSFEEYMTALEENSV